MRRFLIGAVAAAAVFASAAVPAEAHHDTVCAPAVPGPVCVSGLQHVLPETRAQIWAEFEGALLSIAGPLQESPEELQAVPDPLCVGDATPTPVCVTGLRTAVEFGYELAWFAAFVPAWVAGCAAFGPCLTPVLPPA